MNKTKQNKTKKTPLKEQGLHVYTIFNFKYL